MPQPTVIGIVGGSGAGKSTAAKEIEAACGKDRVAVVEQDWYYRDLSHLPKEQAAKTNFDHPDSVELELLLQQLRELKNGKTVRAPQYDFSSFSRKAEQLEIPSKPRIVVEGLFVLWLPELRELFDRSIFIDVPDETRFERRLRRDTAERGYTPQQVRDFWETRARPMYEQFVLPQKKWATTVR